MSTSLKTSAAAFLIAIGFGGAALFAQSAKFDEVSVSKARMDTAKPVSAGQSVLNTSFALDELEERKINDVYEQIVKIHLQGDYPAAANMYETLVIPMAERTRSDLAKNKFLFLGYRGLGNCYLAMSRFSEAEETFQKLFQYMPAWPGMNDSGYPLNFASIAMARIGEQRWRAAEESLRKAVSIFDEQIGLAASENGSGDSHANNLRISENMALNLFAVVYFRQQRYAEALQTLERSYRQGATSGAPRELLQQTAEDGRAVSIAAGDADAIALWSRRSLPNSN